MAALRACWGWVMLMFGIVPPEFRRCGVVTGYAGERTDMDSMIARVLVGDIRIRENWNTREKKRGEDVRLLKTSMGTLGQLNVISVKRAEGDKFDLIAGEMRLLAAMDAGQRYIEARIFEVDLTEEQEYCIMFDENMVRNSLNVIEEANAFSRMLDFKTVDQVASLYDRTTAYIRERLDLLKLPKEVQRMMLRQKNPLRIHQASALVSLNNASKQLHLAREAAPSTATANLSEAEVRALVREAQGERKLPLEEPKPRKKREPVQSVRVGTIPPSPPASTAPVATETETGTTERSPAEEVPAPGYEDVTFIQMHGGLEVEKGEVYLTNVMIRFKDHAGNTNCMQQRKLFLDLDADNYAYLRETLKEDVTS